MRNGGIEGWKIGAMGLAAIVVALVGPGVATVSAKPAAQMTVGKRAAVTATAVAVAASDTVEVAALP
jgi:hypothetical protein